MTVLAIIVVAWGVIAIVLANRHSEAKLRLIANSQADNNTRISLLLDRLTVLEDENKALQASIGAAQTQANTSVGQLTAAGIQPNIAAPNVVTVPTVPVVTTTTPPRLIPVPVPAPVTTSNPASTTTIPVVTTQPPATEPPTTDATTTLAPQTTTTEPPTTTTTQTMLPPDTTTTLGAP